MPKYQNRYIYKKQQHLYTEDEINLHVGRQSILDQHFTCYQIFLYHKSPWSLLLSLKKFTKQSFLNNLQRALDSITTSPGARTFSKVMVSIFS